MISKIRLWWYRRHIHMECVQNQLHLWSGGDELAVPFGACTKCYPRMVYVRGQHIAKARIAERR
jgi:hypothetical protein